MNEKNKIIDIYAEVYSFALTGVKEAMKKLGLYHIDKNECKIAFAPTPEMRSLLHKFSAALNTAILDFAISCGYNPDAPDDDDEEGDTDAEE